MGRKLYVGSILLFLALGVSGAQTQLIAPNVSLTEAAGEFSAIHAELDRAVDNALADTVQHMAVVASDDGHNTHLRSPESLILDFDQRYRPTPRPSISAALKRLYELRPALEPILQSEGIPAEIASVVVVESGGRTNALSPKGALGLWQLMPDTARRYGLEVHRNIDERLDVDKSTRAAARYLRDLYVRFGSWPLALAAYNAGEQAIQWAVERAGTPDFLQLSSLRLLPQETRNYVPAVLSVMQLLGNHQLPDAPKVARMTGSSEHIFAVPGAQP
jgi:membrane-bound lytic murein transglycosylase MltF